MQRLIRLSLCSAITMLFLVGILIILLLTHCKATVVSTDVIVNVTYSYTTSRSNTYSDSIQKTITIISLAEDVDRNNEVDFTDIQLVRKAYGTFPHDSNWIETADIDKNGEVDFSDMILVRKAYGEMLSLEDLLPEKVYFVMP